MSGFGAFLKRRSAYTPWDFILAGCGACAMAFGAFSLFIVGMQRLMLSTQGFQEAPEPFLRMMEILHSLWFLYMPLMCFGGLLAIAGGLLAHADKPIGRRLAQLACIYAVVWVVAYGVDTMSIMPMYLGAMNEAGGELMPPGFQSFQQVAGYGGLVFSVVIVGVPAGLFLWRFSRGPNGSDG